MYQEGYFRQMIDAAGWQQEAYPYDEPSTMPIQPVLGKDGGWLRIGIELPGRKISLRVWCALVGRTTLYLLDSNDPLNGPVDRGITGKLYGGGDEMRLLQEIVLGISGWRAIELLEPNVEICHLNEGHAAFAVFERARSFAQRLGLTFWEGLWATRAGNVFTTHTAVPAGFDRYPPELIAKYVAPISGVLQQMGIALPDLLALGHADSDRADDPINMTYLALRGSLLAFGVSQRHRSVSRRIFQKLFPGWPERQVPVMHVTNGVHMPSWDSREADRIWTAACGKDRWRGMPDELGCLIETLSDEALWALRGAARQALVGSVRQGLKRHLSWRGLAPEIVAQADNVFDPNILTLGFARRFTGYKRPNLLLWDIARLGRLLNDPLRPAQLVVAGKAHPDDEQGPLDASWGYQPIGLFAPTRRFGDPAGFARFIDKAHAAGLGVILDWGFPRIFRPTSTGSRNSMASRSTNMPTRAAGSIRIGTPRSMISVAARWRRRWPQTRSSGSTAITSTDCASTRSLPCSTSTIPAKTGNGCRTQMGAMTTAMRSLFSEVSMNWSMQPIPAPSRSRRSPLHGPASPGRRALAALGSGSSGTWASCTIRSTIWHSTRCIAGGIMTD